MEKRTTSLVIKQVDVTSRTAHQYNSVVNPKHVLSALDLVNYSIVQSMQKVDIKTLVLQTI